MMNRYGSAICASLFFAAFDIRIMRTLIFIVVLILVIYIAYKTNLRHVDYDSEDDEDAIIPAVPISKIDDYTPADDDNQIANDVVLDDSETLDTPIVLSRDAAFAHQAVMRAGLNKRAMVPKTAETYRDLFEDEFAYNDKRDWWDDFEYPQ